MIFFNKKFFKLFAVDILGGRLMKFSQNRQIIPLNFKFFSKFIKKIQKDIEFKRNF